MNKNIILKTDSYKSGHSKLYAKDIKTIYSYLESRGGKYPVTLFFGLQYYLKEYLEGVRVTPEFIRKATAFWTAHLGRSDYFDAKKWEYIVEKHGGKLPLLIKAVPEGTVVPTSNVLMTIENTDDQCYWLTNFIETLLMKIWYPITIATQSYHIRKDVLAALEKSGTPSEINFKVHDFGYRGVSSEETAGIGAAAHLLSFMGTDTVAGIELLQEYYGADMCGFSIPATEHSILCSFGREGEQEAMENLLKEFPDGLIACVSDTYNIYEACSDLWGGVLKDKVLNRNGRLVIRPDSGDFFEVVPKVLEILWDKFGGYTNDKGYKVINDKVRLIQGDGMNPDTIKALYERLILLGWSADNLAVGSGGGLLQQVNRDTQKFAFKCSAAQRGNNWIDVYKEPITDKGKGSKRGCLKLVINDEGQYETRKHPSFENDPHDQLIPVFKNGEILKEWTLAEIKANIK